MTIGLAAGRTRGPPIRLGLISLFLGVSISFTLRFLVNLIAFWTLDVRGFIGLYVVLVGPLLRPLRFQSTSFRSGCGVVAYATPFPSMLQTPIDVLSGRALGLARRGAGLPASSPGCSVLVGVARVMQWRAGRRLVVQGG